MSTIGHENDITGHDEHVITLYIIYQYKGEDIKYKIKESMVHNMAIDSCGALFLCDSIKWELALWKKTLQLHATRFVRPPAFRNMKIYNLHKHEYWQNRGF